MFGMQTTTATETLFCGICRRATADGACERCGDVQHGFVRRRADALRIGDEVVEGCGSLLRVTSVTALGRGMVEVALVSFGPSRLGPQRWRGSRLVAVAFAREAA